MSTEISSPRGRTGRTGGLALLLGLVVVVGLVGRAAAAPMAAGESGGGGDRGGPFVTGLVHWATRGAEVFGIGVIVVGGLVATAHFVVGLRRRPFEAAYQAYRNNLGRAILLGLEILVAADIINTVAVAPSIRNVATLGLIVLIRTFLSFSLEVEINGHWPWEGARRRADGQPSDAA